MSIQFHNAAGITSFLQSMGLTLGSGGAGSSSVAARPSYPTTVYYSISATTTPIEEGQFIPISDNAATVKIVNEDASNFAIVAIADSPIEACDNLVTAINYSTSFIVPPKRELILLNTKKWFAYMGMSATVTLTITQYR